VGLCFVNLPGQFVGPLGNLAGGIDISLPVTLGLASVVYLSLLRSFPEPAAVSGPAVVARELVESSHSPAGLRSSPKKAGSSFAVEREQAPSPQQAPSPRQAPSPQ
jgi:hypothetical protein